MHMRVEDRVGWGFGEGGREIGVRRRKVLVCDRE